MKVRSRIDMDRGVRALFAVSLAWTLAIGGAVAPLAANAEAVKPAEATVASTETSLAALPSLVTTLATPAAPVATAPVKKLTVRQIVAKVGRERGLSKAEVRALLWLCKRESNFHPRSVSRSGCYGLFQLSRGMAKGNPWSDPTWNTKRAIRYMRGRYGGVLQAKAFWQTHHWY